MADINDRLDRLQRREEFDRRSADPDWTPRPAPPAGPVSPVVTRPAGVDDRLGEVLDAVAAVVGRHPGLSVMVAVADGRAGRPVVRVTERDGAVVTGVIVVGSATAPAASPAPGGMPGAVAAPGVPDPAALPGPAPSEAATVPDLTTVQDQAPPAAAVPGADSRPPGAPGMADPAAPTVTGAVPPDGRQPDDRVLDGRAPDDHLPDAARQPGGARRADGRHAAPRAEERSGERAGPGAGWSGTSWHYALWSSGAQSRFRSPEGGPPMPLGHRRPDPALDADRLRLVPEEEPAGAEAPASPGATVPLPENTSQVVSRLAELLRENPSLPSDWSREAPE